MISSERVELMTKLAVLEKNHGSEIRRAEKHFKIDLITNPVWKSVFFVSLLYAAVCALWVGTHADRFLDAIAADQAKNLLLVILTGYGMVLTVSTILSAVISYSRALRASSWRIQYRHYLTRLHQLRADGGDEDEDYWLDDEQADDAPQEHSRLAPPEDGQTLKFEDENYIYYVKAVPKRGKGGRRR